MSPRLSTLCLVCNVQLTEVIIVFPSDKWVALAGWCVVCVFGGLSRKHRQVSCFSQGGAPTLFS